MRIVADLAELERGRPAVMTIGAFDGVHRGHQFLMRQVIDRAHRLEADAVVLTFQPRPEVVLRPGTLQLGDSANKARVIAALGPDVLGILPFNQEVAKIPAGQFLVSILDHINLCEIWIGADFVFGHNREGNVDFLIRSGQQSDFAVHIVPRKPLHDTPISSSLIRKLVSEGDVARAAVFLGHYYGWSGSVLPGRGVGTGLGFPTANLQPPPHQLLPATGIYAAWARIDATAGRSYRGWERSSRDPLGTPGTRWERLPAAVSVGYNPHFHGEQLTVEAFVIDYSADLRGRELGLEFVQRLREERAFDSVEALVAEMHRDVELAREILATSREPGELILEGWR